MKSRILLWCSVIITLITTLQTNATQWEEAMAAGKLPEMTLKQQMQLFGARIAVTAPPPVEEDIPETTTNPTDWWRSVQEGSLPPMTEHQKMMLFGSAQVVQDTPQTDYFDEYSPDEQYYGHGASGRSQRSVDSALDEHNLTGEFLKDAFGVVATSEGRGRMKKILVPVMLALTIVAAILLPALMTVIKLIAVKGLWSGVVSLIISKLIGLKALLEHHHHSDHHHSHNQRPLVVYLPHGKHRRGEDEQWNSQQQQPYGPYDQWSQHEWEQQWRRDGQSPDTL